MKKNKGSASAYRRQDEFTLIELLVTVSITGVLSAVVTASLSGARLKLKYSTVHSSELSSIKVQVETYYNINNIYNGLCFAFYNAHGLGDSSWPNLLIDTQKNTAITSTINVANSAGVYNIITCHDNSNGLTVEVPKSKSGISTLVVSCVDRSQIVKESNNNLRTGILICHSLFFTFYVIMETYKLVSFIM